MKIRDALESATTDAHRRKIREFVSPKAHLALSVDASSLFTSEHDLKSNGQTNVLTRLKRLRTIAQNVTYTTQVS